MNASIRKIALVLSTAVVFLAAPGVCAQNSISGLIFDANRQPVAKIDVELLDEFERLLRSTQTTASGLYFFQGLRAGIYYVQVRTGGTNFREAKERVQVGQANRSSPNGTTGSEALQVNFTLESDRPGSNQTTFSNEVLFAQNVPREAEKYFESALKKLKDEKRDEAVAELENALKIFPEYFLALEKIGYLYLAKAKYAEAEGAFLRALAVNPKSFSAKSGLGIAEYKLGRLREAVKTLEESIVLNQSSANSFLFLGKIQRELKDYAKAETSLKRAKDLSKNKLADVHWELALLYYYNLNRPAEAAAELELYLKAKPDAANKPQIEKLIKQMREKAKEKSQLLDPDSLFIPRLLTDARIRINNHRRIIQEKTIVSIKNANYYRIMPPSASRRSNNQFYQKQPEQESPSPNGSTGSFDKSSFEAPETRVPQRGLTVDIFGGAKVGANAYLIAQWERTSAAVGESVRIRAVLNKGIDGVVRVQVIHEHDGQQVWVESVNGFINKGVVTASWTSKDTVKNWNKGGFFFTIIGGKANATSGNRLTLSGK